MDEKYVWISAIVAILLIMLLFNRKVRLLALIKEQLMVFKNDKTKKISLWDLACFLVFPLSRDQEQICENRDLPMLVPLRAPYHHKPLLSIYLSFLPPKFACQQ